MKKLHFAWILTLGIAACTNTSRDKASTQVGKNEIIAEIGEMKLPNACDVYLSLEDIETLCQDSFVLNVLEEEVLGKNCVRSFVSKDERQKLSLRIHQYVSRAAVRAGFNVLRKEKEGDDFITLGKRSKKGIKENGERIIAFQYFIKDNYLVDLELETSPSACLNAKSLTALTETLVNKLGNLPQ